MKILFFDDEKIRHEIFDIKALKVWGGFTITVYSQSIMDCKDKLQEHIDGKVFYDILHFDHDIQDFQTMNWHNSVGLAEWFVNNCPKDRAPTMVIIHSLNANGSWNLYHIFSRLTKAFMCPFRVEMEEYIRALDKIKEENNAKVQKSEDK